MIGCMRHYVHDDAGYLAWISGHPDGFVINTYTRPSRAYLKLRQATCPTISRLQRGARTFTDGEYTAPGPNWKGTLAAWAEQRNPARSASDTACALLAADADIRPESPAA